MRLPIAYFVPVLGLAMMACSSSGTGITEPETESAGDSVDEMPEVPATPTDSETPTAPPTPTEARYRITFDADWTAERHPEQFPGASAHFSGLVGAVHSEQVIYWEPGQIATAGIEQMAETGSKTLFLDEIDASIANGYAISAINGAGVSTGDGQASVEVVVTQDHSQITITSMLAPSPDWFVGLHNVELFDGGAFLESATVDAVLYDSGTDSGVSFTSSNQDTQPREPVLRTSSQPSESPFVDGLPDVGRFLIERL